jgi:hypothetical protein
MILLDAPARKYRGGVTDPVTRAARGWRPDTAVGRGADPAAVLRGTALRREQPDSPALRVPAVDAARIVGNAVDLRGSLSSRERARVLGQGGTLYQAFGAIVSRDHSTIEGFPPGAAHRLVSR